MRFFTESSYVTIFCKKLCFLLIFVRLPTLVLFFFAFRHFTSFSFIQIKMSEHCPNFYFGNILPYFDLEGVKIHNIKKMVFYTPLQQICNKEMIHACKYALVFSKQLIETNWKSGNFRVIGLILFQQLRKL